MSRLANILRQNDSPMNVRPHPGQTRTGLTPRLCPQPQGRENHSPHFGAMDALGFLTRSESNVEQVATATRASKLSTTVATPSLSSGERAGVRASVNSDQVPQQIAAMAFRIQNPYCEAYD